MNMKLKSKKEQLNIAKETNCEKELSHLSDSPYMNVRRAVARNNSISTYIANVLSTDPVLNVSYVASNHPKCTNKRDFSDTHIVDCVLCEKDERFLDCVECENKKKTLLNV